MRSLRFLAWGTVAVSLVCGTTRALADYETHPELAPSVRCQGIVNPDDCQPLFWDLPAATFGEVAPAAALAGFPDFPGGKTDRPPPLYSDGTNGYETTGPGGAPLCALYSDPALADPDRVPYWKDTGATDANGAELFQVACRRGTRAYYGPWYVGSDPRVFDKLAYKVLAFENSSRLAADGANHELNVSAEIYDHVASHHGTCYVSTDPCANDPVKAATSQCDGFRSIAEACPGEGPSTECPQQQAYGFVAFRSTTARQGRYVMDLPPKRAFSVVEDPMWLCQQHVVAAEPTYDGRPRDFRKQANGAVGEMVVQLFTEAATSGDYEPVSMAFDFVASAATTVIPPFTVMPQDTVWYAPFDLAIGMMTMHSHQNMANGSIDVVPANPPRLNEPRPECGGARGGLPNPHAYENSSYLEPTICEYWRNAADGPLVLRKGEAIRAECIINNGFTPTQSISDPSLRQAVEGSLVGRELYGQQNPSVYRVRYGCEKIQGVPPGAPGDRAADCPPNPNGDGAYDAPAYCPTGLGYTGRCVPANVVFANAGADSMCIPIIMYWPLDRALNADGSPNPQAVESLQGGKVNDVGTPGRVWKSPSDGGTCDDGAGDGPGIDDPNSVTPYKGTRCRTGL